MLEGMDMQHKRMRMLAIDTCGEAAGLALSEGERVVAQRELPSRAASAQILAAMREILVEAGWSLGELDGIGVVAGPGSFTGVRTGLAAAKGICEATGLKLATVSRLAVLVHKAGVGRAALGAGRRDVYVREAAGELEVERMSTIDALLLEGACGGQWVVAEVQLAEALEALEPVVQRLSAADAVPLLLRELDRGGVDPADVDANYVRHESELYAKQGAGPACARP